MSIETQETKQIDIFQDSAIDITPMTTQEARECVAAIKGNMESLRLMLLDLMRRRGWEALGYSNWRECVISEFRQSQAYMYRLAQAAEVEENLSSSRISTIVENGGIPINQLSELAKLPSERQAEGLQLAEDIAQAEGKKRTAAHIVLAVKKIKKSKGTVAEAIADSVESVLPDTLSDVQDKQSSVVKQIPVSLVLELWEIAYPEELREDGEDNTPIFAYCPVPRSWWNGTWDKTWEEHHRPEFEAFNELAEQVNLCLWQIDNTFAIAQTYDVYSVGGRLAEYGLLVMDEDSTLPATAKQLASWLVSKERQYDSIQEIVRDALQDQRFDMLKALEVGQHPPANRHEYWTQRYAGELAKTGVDYWQWRGNPESRQICPELTQLLELPRPNPDASTVLERLADGEDPFQCFPLVHHAAERKESYRKAFIKWHEKALAQIGLEALLSLYTVVYGCDWELIENIINPVLGGEWWEVLGVPRYASAGKVKAAHRKLAKEWHPDVNPSPLARERMVIINRALEEFENGGIGEVR